MDIVAEGVETEFEAVMMTKLGCSELQGYYFSTPLAADEMSELLHTYQPRRLAPTLVAVEVAPPRGAAR
jgi:EAL domain-containing protein (putative c-di-GMP-specific phosphodiesterase class I)